MTDIPYIAAGCTEGRFIFGHPILFVIICIVVLGIIIFIGFILPYLMVMCGDKKRYELHEHIRYVPDRNKVAYDR